MQLNPYLVFNGQCEAAFKFYAECLGGRIAAMMPHRGTRERHGANAAGEDILGATLRNAGRSIRRPMDGELRMSTQIAQQRAMLR